MEKLNEEQFAFAEVRFTNQRPAGLKDQKVYKPVFAHKSMWKMKCEVGCEVGSEVEREVERFWERFCPRCGREVSYVERQVKGSQTYYYAVHYFGYEVVNGKVKKKVKKCYLGPREYEYVEKLHSLGLAGLIDRERFRRYLKELLDSTEMDLKELLEVVRELATRALEEVEELDSARARELLEEARAVWGLLGKVYHKLYEKHLVARFSRKGLREDLVR